MTINKNTIIIVLVLVIGLVTGMLLADLLASQPAHPLKRVITTEFAPAPIGPYSQAIQAGDFVFLSGQIGIDPATGNVTGAIDGQTKQAMNNLRAVLQKSGLDFGDVVSTKIYLTNLSNGAAVNTIYGSYFNGTYPTRATVQVAGLPKGALVEIEMVAQKR
jgi:reactive intermediate/imine deaminase